MSGIPKWTLASLGVTVAIKVAIAVAERAAKNAQIREKALEKVKTEEMELRRNNELDRINIALKAGIGNEVLLREALKRLKDAISEAEITQSISYAKFASTHSSPTMIFSDADVTKIERANLHLQLELLEEQEEIFLSELLNDSVYGCWLAPEIEEERHRVAEAKCKLHADDIEGAKAEMEGIHSRLESKYAWAISQQETVEQRNYIAEHLQRCLSELGYINVSFPQAEHPDHPMSALVMTADLDSTGQQSIEISVPYSYEGQETIRYMIHGAQFGRKVASDGSIVTSCDDIEEMLNELHMQMNKYGINNNGLHWDSKDPLREGGQEQQLTK